MKMHKLILTMRSTSSNIGNVRASDFAREIQHLLSSLKQTERFLAPTAGKSISYEVIDLKHGSPACVSISARPIDEAYDITDQVLSNLGSVIKSIRNKSFVGQPTSANVLSDLRDMAIPIGDSLQSVILQIDEESFELDISFRKEIDQLLVPEESYPGFIRGMLEAINLHRDANVFRIYPDVGPQKITCYFPAELENSIVDALGRFVEVHGVMKYKVHSPYAHEMVVEKLVALPDESELPRFIDLRGIAPHATGEMSSEDFVRVLRHASK